MHPTAITAKKANNSLISAIETYEDWILARLLEYLDYYAQKIGSEDKPATKRCIPDIPSRLGFSYYIGTTRGRLNRLGKKFPNTIGYQLEKLDDLKQLLLVEGGLTKKYNPSIVIFLLKTQHRYIEQSKKEYLHILRNKKSLHFMQEVQKLSDTELEARVSAIKQTQAASA